MDKVKAIRNYIHPRTGYIWLAGIPIPGLTKKQTDKGIKDGYLVALVAKGYKKVIDNGDG